ncbi:MAG: methionine aminotransferase [Bacteroidota bacterium]|nr:methionine aminotransferase [Bacteroidota bacterium]MDX5431897.1 methionine aminotransferase [Bacteroidota bacterium]MDX5470611.1 methionine aminotransferase [Bacteroidota bacterium]
MPEFHGNIASKLPKVGTTIFSIMSGLANEHGALNMAQGFPDFACSPKLIDRVNHYMNAGLNQYAPMPGVLALREKIAQKTEELYSATYHPETEVTIVPGATLGIYAAISAVVKEGDEVIILEPAYDSYLPAVELNGGRPVFAELKYPNYQIDWDEVRKLITFKTRMIIINTPHNPTGMAFSALDMQKLQKLTENSDIIILSDEVYEHILFEGLEHQSVARYPKLAERSFIISSFGKTYHNTGWKMGYCLAPANLMKEFRKIFQFMAFSVNTPIQYALADHMDDREEYLKLNAFYQGKRDLFQKALKGSKWKVLPCQGSYFQMLGYEKITHEADQDYARRLVKEHKIAAIPPSSFYRKGNDYHVLRFCFAKEDDTLLRAAEILQGI